MTHARFLVMGLMVVGACHRDRDKRDECLPLPAAVRAELVADPNGQWLYWLERNRNYDYDADMNESWHLMGYNVRTRQTELVVDDASGPIMFIGGQLLVTQHTARVRLMLRTSDGHTQEVTPTWLDIEDVEPVDAHTIAFLATGDGPRAVYMLDVNEQRSYHLADADTLLSSAGGKVFTRVEDEVVIVDARTRETTTVPWIKKSIPQGDRLLYVEKGNVLASNMVTHATASLVTTNRPWRLTYQGASTLARTAPAENRSYAYLITGDAVTPLPTVVGGASILGTAQIGKDGKDTWALIGHNSANYIGDLAKTDAEVDVCLLPTTSEVTYPTRQVPARFSAQEDQLFDTLRATSPGATMGLLDQSGEPPTMFVDLKKEFAARDLDAMRKRVREIYDAMTRWLHDREIRTEILYADKRTAILRWKRDRLRTRTLVGMGDALIGDRADFDFEVSNLENTRADGKITCRGALLNLTHRALASVDIKCSGNRKHLIHIDNLGPDEARAFSQTFEISPVGEGAYVEIMVDGKSSEPFDADANATVTSVFELATEVYGSTGLWLTAHEVDEDEIVVHLRGETKLLDETPTTVEQTLQNAYKRYSQLRTIYDVEAARPLRLAVDFDPSETTLSYDGDRMTRDD